MQAPVMNRVLSMLMPVLSPCCRRPAPGRRPFSRGIGFARSRSFPVRALFVFLGVLCAAVPALAAESTSAISSSARIITASAKSLVVQPSDLPVPFALSGGDHLPSGGYGGLYFRPEILMESELPSGGLLGVMTSVELLPGHVQAEREFSAKNSAASIRASVGDGGGGPAQEIDSTALEAVVDGADDAALFRVDYVLNGVRVVDYRYALRVENAVASLVVSGRTGSGGAEPAELESQAREIARRQAVRLLAARP